MHKYYTTPEEHTKAVLEAMEEIHKENMKSKEASLNFLIRAGIIQEDKPEEPKAESQTKNSK